MSVIQSNESVIAIHPGYYVQQYLDQGYITPKNLAMQLRVPVQEVKQLTAGKLALDEEWCVRLATAFGTSVTLWRNLMQQYHADLEKVKQ